MKYEVTLFYHTSCIVTVEADNEEEALDKAHAEVCDEQYTAQILEGLQEDGSPYIEEVQ